MSSPSVSLVPLSHKKSKKKGPNFRPAARRKAKAAGDVPEFSSTSEEPNTGEINEQNINETPENPINDSAVSEEITTSKATSTKRSSTATRKRKGVAIGFSRPSKSSRQDTSEESIAAGRKEIPKDSSGGPTLNSFCSRFRTRRNKKSNTDETVLQEQKDIADVEARPAGPLVKIVNGEIVLQESSVVVNAATNKPEDEFPVIEEEAQTAVVGASYNSFVNRRAPQHWTIEETELFYEALRQVGVDFSTMEAYFGKKRTRKHLKRKYQTELTKNPHLIDAALNPAVKKDIDLTVFNVTAEMIEKIDQEKSDLAKTNDVDTHTSNVSETTTPENQVNPIDESSPSHQGKTFSKSHPETTLAHETLEAEESEEAMLGDPMFQDEAGQASDEILTVSLVPVASKTKVKNKPRFRSSRKGGK